GIANHTWSMPMPATLEAQITRYADRIAYINHDIDDAIRAGILSPLDLPAITTAELGADHSSRIKNMVTDLLGASEGAAEIRMSPRISEAMATTREFLFERVYLGQVAAATRKAVERVVETLLEHYADNPAESDESVAGDPRARAVDYVAGMTDRFAIRAFEGLVGGSWGGFEYAV
ncbi:MAG TPA: deoxyguanosinetriphosphate triphosphohydrolase, partial [Actinomycetota bacterium]|nr:deoxyguanosinetriphosphate triphosphohydrolase [Actinomycetota bacterium]